MSNMLTPPPSLLCKLGSIAVHVEELLSPSGHPFDREALAALLADTEVRAWLGQMEAASLVPKKR
jgi:hypothetical protein